MRLHMGRGGGWDNGIGNVCCLNGVEGEGRELIVLNPLRAAIITHSTAHTHTSSRPVFRSLLSLSPTWAHTNLDYMMAIYIELLPTVHTVLYKTICSAVHFQPPPALLFQ